ncbi:helix-turn-helix domain-containing protein [Catenulispora yoronensis]|uniref:Helix-turn-helix domain-containing protein n=1 Tax=Catenulispora yoronensis TaxID=450799 RepID=A0ABP5H977_9ACTN
MAVPEGVPELPTGPGIDPACPLAAFPFQVGGKWTGMVLVALADGPQRFSSLRQALGSVTAKVLTQTLRDMARDGLVTRLDRQENPPHVEYGLTDLGRSLTPVIEAMRAWSDRHLAELLVHRERNGDLAVDR